MEESKDIAHNTNNTPQNSIPQNNTRKKKVPPSGAKKVVKKVKKQKKTYKNLGLILVALALFVYAAFISIVPVIITNTFNLTDFATGMTSATSLITNAESFRYEIKPNLHGVIGMTNFKVEWNGGQPIFSSKYLEIETKNPLAVVTKNFDIDSLSVVNANYTDQMIYDENSGKNINKLEVVTPYFDPQKLGVKSITVKPGNVKVKNFHVAYIDPNSYRDENIMQKVYPRIEVKKFLLDHPVNGLNIK